MSGADGLVSCVGGCHSKLFSSRRVHRPLVDNNSNVNIHLLTPRQSLTTEKSEQCSTRQNRLQSITLPMPSISNVKKSRKRRDRRYTSQ